MGTLPGLSKGFGVGSPEEGQELGRGQVGASIQQGFMENLSSAEPAPGLWHWRRWGPPGPYASSRKALSSIVGLSGPTLLPLPGPCFLLGCLGGVQTPGFTSAKEMNCLQEEEASPAQDFALRTNIWVLPSPSPRPEFWGMLGLYSPGSQFTIMPSCSSYPRPVTAPPPAPKLETPDLWPPSHLYLPFIQSATRCCWF